MSRWNEGGLCPLLILLPISHNLLTSSGELAVRIVTVSGILVSYTESSYFRFEHNRAISKNEVPRLGRVFKNRGARENVWAALDSTVVKSRGEDKKVGFQYVTVSKRIEVSRRSAGGLAYERGSNFLLMKRVHITIRKGNESFPICRARDHENCVYSHYFCQLSGMQSGSPECCLLLPDYQWLAYTRVLFVNVSQLIHECPFWSHTGVAD